jgi:hypothetical protein
VALAAEEKKEKRQRDDGGQLASLSAVHIPASLSIPEIVNVLTMYLDLYYACNTSVCTV